MPNGVNAPLCHMLPSLATLTAVAPVGGYCPCMDGGLTQSEAEPPDAGPGSDATRYLRNRSPSCSVAIRRVRMALAFYALSIAVVTRAPFIQQHQVMRITVGFELT
jgi:hypothetical protein